MTNRLKKQAGSFSSIQDTKIGSSIITVFGDIVEEAILNAPDNKGLIKKIGNMRFDIERMNEYIKLFLEYDGAECIFDSMHDVYSVTDTFNEEIKSKIEKIVKDYDAYTSANLMLEGDSALEHAKDYLEDMTMA